jgi:hypothetical protein
VGGISHETRRVKDIWRGQGDNPAGPEDSFQPLKQIDSLLKGKMFNNLEQEDGIEKLIDLPNIVKIVLMASVHVQTLVVDSNVEFLNQCPRVSRAGPDVEYLHAFFEPTPEETGSVFYQRDIPYFRPTAVHFLSAGEDL